MFVTTTMLNILTVVVSTRPAPKKRHTSFKLSWIKKCSKRSEIKIFLKYRFNGPSVTITGYVTSYVRKKSKKAEFETNTTKN